MTALSLGLALRPEDNTSVGAVTPPAYREVATCMRCEGEQLVGIVSLPIAAACDTGVVIVVGGPQYRAGSHRQFVQIARALAQGGWPTMRFDVRGMGDSTGSSRDFEHITPDIAAAVDALFAVAPGLRRVVLWGLCDAASAALLYVDERSDPRIAGLVLLNPWVRSAETLARAQVQGYYARRLLSRELWSSLLRGRVRLASVGDFARTLARVATRGARTSRTPGPLSFQDRMTRGWLRFAGPSLLVLSGRDLTAQEFEQRSRIDPALARASSSKGVTMQRLEDADHTLSQCLHTDEHVRTLLDWLSALDAQPAANAGSVPSAPAQVP
jgi:exosortase A-associated hydrolase 1